MSEKRRLLTLAALTLAMVGTSLVSAAPASATTISGAFEELSPNGTYPYIGATCASGEGFVSGTATFYKKPYMQGTVVRVVQGVVNQDDWPHGMFAPVPKQARSVSFTYTCVPIGAPATISGVFASEDWLTVNCPSESPHLVSYGEVVADSDGDLATPEGQYYLFYVQIRSGVQIHGPVGHAWQVTLTCAATKTIPEDTSGQQH